MANEITPNAGGEQEPVEKTNITVDGLTALRTRQLSPKAEEPKEPIQEEPKPEPEAEDKPEAEQPKETQSQEEAKSEEKEVLSKDIDLETLSEVELKELAEKLGSRAVARFGELTAKRKAAEEQLAALKAELQKRQESPDPLSERKTEKNPYAELKSLDELKAKAQELDESIEWLDDVLWNSDHLGADDVVTQVNGRDITKAQVRKALKDAQKARKEYLPSQLKEIQAAEQRKQLKATLENAVRQEIPWLEGEDNDTRKQFEALRSSPILKKAAEAVPDFAPYADYLVAHAVNSVYARKEIPLDKPKSQSLTPPSSPNAAAAASEKPEGRTDKAVKEIRNRLFETGSAKDFEKLRIAQLSKRK